MEGSEALKSTDTLEVFAIEVEAKVSQAIDARLATIDARLSRIEGFVTTCEAMAAQLQESPMFAMLGANAEAQFGFPNAS